MTEKHHAALGWAIIHAPTREAYRRSIGEDIAPALDRYRQWLEENIIGRPEDFGDEADAA
ncbi:hypothetical protein [Sinorhizobium psoraleae]|uniref:Uncharacterized protein n=1 Tax=Sinorhizobium psoraleae TaxID=520838 RepID=A0ABT4KIG2_9HYPH|nr:hypothetical protein [Sinorhizobium psoraleae]MCZ4091679.1 hypothetical protein [Sinorhizobium psoraleae]